MIVRPNGVSIALAFSCAALLVGLASCCAFNDVCTLVGCNDGLQVHVSGDLPAELPVTVEAVARDGERREREALCAGQPRVCQASFEGFWPEEVMIRVTSGSRSVAQTGRPSYSTLRPNGRCCPPSCRTAAVSIAF